mmetsp:Transcript_50057/g.119087  ORF Transcript_50057/g.119087 Transcript_50057/m.119087 type:complete len:202 (-) Transcript_50057:51-656(-)
MVTPWMRCCAPSSLPVRASSSMRSSCRSPLVATALLAFGVLHLQRLCDSSQVFLTAGTSRPMQQGSRGVLIAGAGANAHRMFRVQRHASLEEALDEEEDEDLMDLENNPRWQEVQQQMKDIWDSQWDITSEMTGQEQEWKIADDVRLIMDEHIRGIIGLAKFTELEEALYEAAEEEPNPGEISREDFMDIAGAFVYEQFYM